MSMSVKNGADKSLARKLRELPDKVFQRVFRGAVNKGATPLSKAIRKATPKKTGALAKSMGKASRTDKQRGAVTVTMGVRQGFVDKKTKKRPILYAAKVNRRQQFVESAVAANESRVVSDLRSKLIEGIEKEGKR